MRLFFNILSQTKVQQLALSTSFKIVADDILKYHFQTKKGLAHM